jgi:hypothetical protein
MIEIPRKLLALTLIGTLIALAAGCDEDRRVAAVAERAAERQAAQNEEMARVNREVAEGTRRLVEADAQARKELAAAQRQLQEEQAKIGTQRDALETERKEMAQQRRTVSLLAPIITGCAALLAVGLLGAFCWSLLFGLRREDDAHDELSMLLLDEITTPGPKRLGLADLPRSASSLSHQQDTPTHEENNP